MNTQTIRMEKREARFHLVFWLLMMASMLYAWSNNLDLTHIVFRWISTILTFILPIYVNTLILIPRYFKRKSWLRYGTSLLALLIAAKAINTVFLLVPWMIRDWSGVDFGNEFFKFMFREFRNLDKWIFSQTAWIVFFSFAYHFVKEWFVNEQVKSRLTSEKLSMELALLKTQVNPHFLFNTLNSIYAVALEEKAHETAQSIAKLGALMRYSLHDTQSDFILLTKELDYLEQYIELQRMRLTENQQLAVDYNFANQEIQSLKIAPMILIPFIENAFKYGSSTTEQTNINLSISLSYSTLHLMVENTIHKHRETDEASGLGLENVKSRLNIVYFGKYSLDHGQKGHVYRVDLKLQLNQ